MVVIDNNVEAAALRMRYPLKDMSVGDSFFVEATDRTVMARRIRSSIQFYTKNNPSTKFIVRSVDGGVRCWRLE